MSMGSGDWPTEVFAGPRLVLDTDGQIVAMTGEEIALGAAPLDASLALSLLIIGKLGIHADPELDIGGNAENLLRNVDCAVLLSQYEHRPAVDVIAEVTTSWSEEAESRMEAVPEFFGRRVPARR